MSAGKLNASRDKAASISHSTEKIDVSPALIRLDKKLDDKLVLYKAQNLQDNTLVSEDVSLEREKAKVEKKPSVHPEHIAKSPINIISNN